MTGQMAFDLPSRPAFGRYDYFLSDANRHALEMVEQDHAWPNGRLILVGPSGAGKTHLATIWAEANAGCIVAADQITLSQVPDLARTACLVIEDAARVAGAAEPEAALFHLCNLVAAASGRMLLTATAAPRDWGIGLPDLSSRLQASGMASLAAPDDALLSAVLVKLFSDRQIEVDPSLIAYLIPRMDRSFAAALRIVARLDRMALERGTAISRALAGELLAQPFAETDT